MFVNGKGSVEQSFESGGEKTHLGNKNKLQHTTFFQRRRNISVTANYLEKSLAGD